MKTLYEIDSSILNILALLEPDEQTGEIPNNYEDLDAQLQSLQMERFEKLRNVAKYLLNVRAESEMLRDEIDRLSSRKKALDKKEESLVSYLDYACGGEKTNLGIATVNYRNTEKVEVSDFHKAIQFLASNHHSDCYRTFDPEIAKKEVKALIKSGTQVPGIEIVQNRNCSVK